MFRKAKFDEYKDRYKEQLTLNPNSDIVLWDECRKKFENNWDLEALDFRSMYNKTLKSTINTSLWKGHDYHPKEVMLSFIDYDKEIVRSIFRDLFDERREIGGRMERFVFYCDQLLKEIQERGSKFYSHYHMDLFIVSMYLTFVYPENYTLYKYDIFRNSMLNLGAKSPPMTNEMERYFKIVKVLDKFLSDDKELTSIFKNIEGTEAPDNGKTLLMTYDFLSFSAGNL